MTAVAAQGRVLIIAGSDSGGGAGIQADIKTVTMLGGYAATAITALTAQNTLGVHGVQAVDPSFVIQQAQAVLEDIGADVIKLGMLPDGACVAAVADFLEGPAAGIPLVLDPVMVATSGDSLSQDEGVALMAERLVPRATLVTPNIPEAEVLAGVTVTTADDMAGAAELIRGTTTTAVLLKGGHLSGATITDLLLDDAGITLFESHRIDSRNTHGTGCTLASAIACELARGARLAEAIETARGYVANAIKAAPGFGAGHGPLGFKPV